ncbi:hypothetical protein RYX36_000391 [Vicia faba]
MDSVVNFYATCRKMDDEFKMFNRISHKNLVSLNTVVMAYALNGFVSKAWWLVSDIMNHNCEVHSVVDVNNHSYFLTWNALNEFDPKYSGVDWRR